MSPDPIHRKGRKTLAKIYDSLSDPEEAADRSRIIGLPTKKEAHDIRNELTAAAWAGGKSVSRIRTAKEYISIAESFFRKLRAIKNAEQRTPQTGIPTLRELLRDTRVTNLDECERMIETARADTAILLVGRKDLRGEGARILLALNKMRPKWERRRSSWPTERKKTTKPSCPRTSPSSTGDRQRRGASFQRLPFAPAAHAPGWPPFPLSPCP